MKRILTGGLLALLAIFAGRAIYIAMASDETKITWLLEDEADWFNSTATLSTLSHFAMDYRDETTGVDRQSLRAAVIWAFHNKRDRAQQFLYRTELPDGIDNILVDGDQATATFKLRLHEGAGDDETLVWEALITASLERQDGDWLILSSTHDTLRGKLR